MRRRPNYSGYSDEPLAKLIREERERRGWTNSELARRIDRDQSLVSRWQRGATPGLDALAALARVFGRDVLELQKLAGYMEWDDAMSYRDRHPYAKAVNSQLDRIQWTDDRYSTLQALLDMWQASPVHPVGI